MYDFKNNMMIVENGITSLTCFKNQEKKKPLFIIILLHYLAQDDFLIFLTLRRRTTVSRGFWTFECLSNCSIKSQFEKFAVKISEIVILVYFGII